MTVPPPPGDYPPPPPGNYPPPPPGNYPPPPPGNYPPPPPGYAMVPNAVGILPQDAYTSWVKRVAAFFIDVAPIVLIYLVPMIIATATAEQECVRDPAGFGISCIITPTPLGAFLLFLGWLGAVGFALWNYGYRQGVTGSSIGKSLLKFKVVSETTGRPIGFLLSVVRQLAHIIDSCILCIGYLFPLWDAKRQTLADKIMTTVCLPTD